MHRTRDYPDEFRIEGRVFRETLQRLTRTFFVEVQQKTGSYCYRGFLWHAFSYGFQSAFEHHKAAAAFDSCEDTELYVYDEDLDMLWFCPRSVANSDTHPCNDTYVFPATFDWLYITTHEHTRGIGPYFVSRAHLVVECG